MVLVSKNVQFVRLVIKLQGVSKKNVPNTKLDYLQNNGYQQQPAANIGQQMCISVNFVFICSIL